MKKMTVNELLRELRQKQAEYYAGKREDLRNSDQDEKSERVINVFLNKKESEEQDAINTFEYLCIRHKLFTY